MAIPLLDYAPSSQNQRVSGFEIPGDESPYIYRVGSGLSSEDMNALIQAAYRQIFNEQQMLASNRQSTLETRLKAGSITVREFIRGLATSDTFRIRNYDVNNNYRFVDMCVQRILGRKVYNDRETIAWSIVLATHGLDGFIDALLNSDEYQQNFGEHTVPYQRRRILPQRTQGDLPFARMARYGVDYRDQLPQATSDDWFNQLEQFNFATFVQKAAWGRVTGVLTLMTLVISFLLLFAYLNAL